MFFNIQYFTIQVEEVEFFNFMRILKFELSESGNYRLFRCNHNYLVYVNTFQNKFTLINFKSLVKHAQFWKTSLKRIMYCMYLNGERFENVVLQHEVN